MAIQYQCAFVFYDEKDERIFVEFRSDHGSIRSNTGRIWSDSTIGVGDV